MSQYNENETGNSNRQRSRSDGDFLVASGSYSTDSWDISFETDGGSVNSADCVNGPDTFTDEFADGGDLGVGSPRTKKRFEAATRQLKLGMRENADGIRDASETMKEAMDENVDKFVLVAGEKTEKFVVVADKCLGTATKFGKAAERVALFAGMITAIITVWSAVAYVAFFSFIWDGKITNVSVDKVLAFLVFTAIVFVFCGLFVLLLLSLEAVQEKRREKKKQEEEIRNEIRRRKEKHEFEIAKKGAEQRRLKAKIERRKEKKQELLFKEKLRMKMWKKQQDEKKKRAGLFSKMGQWTPRKSKKSSNDPLA